MARKSRNNYSSRPTLKSNSLKNKFPSNGSPSFFNKEKTGGFLNNMFSSITTGFSHGIGFNFANKLFYSLFGGKPLDVHHHMPTNNNDVRSCSPNLLFSNDSESNQRYSDCKVYLDALTKCLQTHSDFSQCQYEVDSLKMCQSSH